MKEEMKDKLNKELFNLIDFTKDSIVTGIDFAQKQIPEVLQQILMWNFVESLIYFSIGAVLLLVLTPVIIKYHKKCYKETNRDDVVHIPFALIYTINLMISGGLIFNNLTWIKIWVAPKLYLIEYAASLVK